MVDKGSPAAFGPEHAEACARYEQLRAMERARLDEWRDDLHAAAELVGDLHDDLMKFHVGYAPFPNAAAHEPYFRSERIREIDRKIRALLAGNAELREARVTFLCSVGDEGPDHEPDPLPRRWTDMFEWTSEPEFTVGRLALAALQRLEVLLSSLKDACWTSELFTLSRLRGDEASGKEGRRRAAAARYITAWCEEHGVALDLMARAVVGLGVEPPRDPPPPRSNSIAYEAWLDGETKRVRDAWRKKKPAAGSARPRATSVKGSARRKAARKKRAKRSMDI